MEIKQLKIKSRFVSNRNKPSARKSKKAFAFTFLALFLSMVIFAFIHLSMYEGDYTKDNIYKESRIAYVNDEIKYFKQTYLPSSISYTLYNVLSALEEYSRNSTNYAKINQNYSRFNEFILEGMLHGSFNGTLQPVLISGTQNKTIRYFLNLYKEDFSEYHKGNFTFDILNIIIFEEKPYYVTARIYANLSITTQDNISSWNSLETIEVSVPIYDLDDPRFLIIEDQYVKLKASEYNFPAQNWTIENFEEALMQTYSTVYFDSTHKYSLGDSFLNRLLNVSSQGYKGVNGFWSFDHDVDEGGIYDTSNYSEISNLFANSRLIMNFDNRTINFTTGNVPDITDYQSNGTIVNTVDCNVIGISNTGCFFDGVDDYIEISRDDLNLSNTNKISISAWINPQSFSLSTNNIFRYGINANDNIALRLSPIGRLSLSIGDHIGGIAFDSISQTNISLNKWSHVVVTYDGDTGITKTYINGFLDNEETLSTTDNFTDSINNIAIGAFLPGITEEYHGTIDELSIYSKSLSEKEIALLYRERKALHLDYLDSFHGKAIRFDGIDDYIQIEDNDNLDIEENLSIEVWFTLQAPIPSRQQLVNKWSSGVGAYSIEIVDNKTIFNARVGGSDVSCSAGTVLVPNKWYYFVGVYNQEVNLMYAYLNGRLLNDTCGAIGNINTNNLPLVIGKNSSSETDFFQGIIDEVKIYNRTLSRDEIRSYYFNYDSLSKGCCNYITLIDPHKFGYNDTAYRFNSSYSSRMFYNFYRNNIRPDILLWNISTITSYDPSQTYYNFILDQCMIEAYSVLDYQNETIIVEYHNQTGIHTCTELVRQGYY